MYVCGRAGVDLASVEVRFDNLKIEANIAVGARGNPSVMNSYRNIAEVLCWLLIFCPSSYIISWLQLLL